MSRILLLGGAGFVGRHVAKALLARGHEITIGTRSPRRAAARLPAELRGLERLEVHLEWLTVKSEWARRLRGFDLVVNAVGILRERGFETYDRIHRQAPEALGAACARLGLRVIHLSALGLNPDAMSRFITSKLRGEAALAKSGADYIIVRPSLLEGEGGFGSRWLRTVARWPVHFVPEDADGRIAVLHVEDLARAIAVLCEPTVTSPPRIVELGGSRLFTIGEYLAALRAVERAAPARKVKVPSDLAMLGALLCDLAHFSPFSFGHLELMRRDNAPQENLLPALIGRKPTPVAARPAPTRPELAPDFRDAVDSAS